MLYYCTTVRQIRDACSFAIRCRPVHVCCDTPFLSSNAPAIFFSSQLLARPRPQGFYPGTCLGLSSLKFFGTPDLEIAR